MSIYLRDTTLGMGSFQNRNLMRISLLLTASCGILPQLVLYGASPIPRLAGIVCLPDQKLAMLEVVPAQSAEPRYLILSEGQRDGEVEVARIDPASGTVNARTGGTSGLAALRFEAQTNRIAHAALGLLLDHAGMDPVLRIYSQLTGKTLLRSPRVLADSFTLGCSATNRSEMVLVLEQALREKRIASIPDGDKFLMVVPEAEARTVQPRSSTLKARGKGHSGRAGFGQGGSRIRGGFWTEQVNSA